MHAVLTRQSMRPCRLHGHEDTAVCEANGEIRMVVGLREQRSCGAIRCITAISIIQEFKTA